MSDTTTSPTPGPGPGDFRLEVIVLPVSDVDRAKDFYASLGWRLDADVTADAEFRLVQFTPTGSGCSIQFGIGVSSALPGSVTNIYLAVTSIEAARDDLLTRGIAVGDVFHEGAPGARFRNIGRIAGRAPDGSAALPFASFSDPDGNSWLLQEITVQ